MSSRQEELLRACWCSLQWHSYKNDHVLGRRSFHFSSFFFKFSCWRCHFLQFIFKNQIFRIKRIGKYLARPTYKEFSENILYICIFHFIEQKNHSPFNNRQSKSTSQHFNWISAIFSFFPSRDFKSNRSQATRELHVYCVFLYVLTIPCHKHTENGRNQSRHKLCERTKTKITPQSYAFTNSLPLINHFLFEYEGYCEECPIDVCVSSVCFWKYSPST